jgi:hypothetical protein
MRFLHEVIDSVRFPPIADIINGGRLSTLAGCRYEPPCVILDTPSAVAM